MSCVIYEEEDTCGSCVIYEEEDTSAALGKEQVPLPEAPGGHVLQPLGKHAASFVGFSLGLDWVLFDVACVWGTFCSRLYACLILGLGPFFAKQNQRSKKKGKRWKSKTRGRNRLICVHQDFSIFFSCF